VLIEQLLRLDQSRWIHEFPEQAMLHDPMPKPPAEVEQKKISTQHADETNQNHDPDIRQALITEPSA
jgi:hypothetical protein